MQVNLVDQQQQSLQRIKNSWQSFFKRYFNTNSLKLAILFSLPIYLSIFGDNILIRTINTISAIIAIFYFLNVKHSFFQTGFFIGVFWFWWIGLSFRYYNLSYLIPFIIFLIGFGYGIIFWSINKLFNIFNYNFSLITFNFSLNKLFWSIFLIFGFDYISPFTFDWLKPEVIISNSLYLPYKITLFFIILASLIKHKVISLVLLIIPLFFPNPKIKHPPLKIKLITTYIPQDKKWDPKYIPKEIENNFKYIKNSIRKYDVVILPESAFPIFLNKYPELLKKLKTLSKKITIITGALHLKNYKFYNSTYIFENGNIKIVDKHKLVPFGEYIPLPFFEKEINQIFFKGASDYKTSKTFSTFKIKNIKFINAICYEATIENLYKLNANYVIALSNMAWFYPSIAPILQKLLINIYAIKYKRKVFHSINYYPSYILPKEN
ncbi:apolipoprotein N-acyltransferase [Caminibacter profundus]